jgi:hypothetical protein
MFENLKQNPNQIKPESRLLIQTIKSDKMQMYFKMLNNFQSETHFHSLKKFKQIEEKIKSIHEISHSK